MNRQLLAAAWSQPSAISCSLPATGSWQLTVGLNWQLLAAAKEGIKSRGGPKAVSRIPAKQCLRFRGGFAAQNPYALPPPLRGGEPGKMPRTIARNIS